MNIIDQIRLERAYRKGRYDEAERWANKDADSY